ncbi:unnamed protein product [Adineta ricciae]|uniref:protein-tyrosine-phosphatase n=1 Tax=Adineta ricciae TaxID=249248 RepID=A0A814XV14_ADIRI|nr:unnamed protein product [Adineta ricciae]
MSKTYSCGDIRVNDISTEDFYNKLYWDHRIYDIRSGENYIRSHICRAHNMHPYSTNSIKSIEQEIESEYGKSEHPSTVLIYKSQQTDPAELNVLINLLEYLKSNSRSLKEILILNDGFENFQFHYPYLCSDSVHYNECLLLVWPSCINSNLYLGSSMCRNELVLSLLKITHVISFSDYPPENLRIDNIQTVHWQISDSLSSNLLEILPSAVERIRRSIHDEDGVILIHCDQGVSRSASIVIAYLLTSDINFLSVDDAFAYVKSKRNVIKPNSSFLTQLEEYLVSIRQKK